MHTLPTSRALVSRAIRLNFTLTRICIRAVVIFLLRMNKKNVKIPVLLPCPDQVSRVLRADLFLNLRSIENG